MLTPFIEKCPLNILYISDHQLGYQHMMGGSGPFEGPASYPQLCWWSLISAVESKNLYNSDPKVLEANLKKQDADMLRNTVDSIKQWYPIFSILGALFFLHGCSESGWNENADILIRVGQHVVTRQDFSDALEIAKVAYPHNAMQDDVLIKEMRIRVLDQLSDEAVLLARAKALDITVSDAEIETVILKVKSRYPDESFQHAFLQSAISYPSWIKRLKNRMIMEKVIKKDLEDRIEISLKDITDFIKNQDQGIDGQLDLQEETVKIDKATIDFLRRDKAEKAYRQWMNELKEKYPIEINEALWKRISDL